MADNTIKIFTIKVDTESGQVKINGITKSFKEAEIALKQLNEQAKNTTETGLNPLTGATGLAGATITELGRTVSDLNYGFPAVANNISQLGSLFTILTTKANGAKGAFQLIKQEMSGPLGILFAFQVGITLIEAISKGFIKLGKDTNTLTEAFKDLNNSFSQQSSKFKAYVKILNESNVPLKERKELVEELNEENKDLNLQLDEEGRLTEESTRLTNDYIKTLETKAKAQAIVSRLQEIYNKELERETEEVGENLSFLQKVYSFIKIEKDYNRERIISTMSLENKTKAQEKDNKETEKLLSLLGQLGVIPEINTKKDKDRLKRKKDFVAKELSFADDILKSEDRISDKVIKNQFKRLEQENKLQSDLAEIRFNEYKTREEDRVAAIKDPEDRAKAEIKSAEAIKKSEQSLQDFKVQLENETSAKILQIKIEQAVEQLNILEELNGKEREAILSFEALMATNLPVVVCGIDHGCSNDLQYDVRCQGNEDVHR